MHGRLDTSWQLYKSSATTLHIVQDGICVMKFRQFLFRLPLLFPSLLSLLPFLPFPPFPSILLSPPSAIPFPPAFPSPSLVPAITP